MWRDGWKEQWQEGWKEERKDEGREEQKEEHKWTGECNKKDQTKTGKWQWPRSPPKCWVHIFLHPPNDFKMIPMFLGKHGKNMKQIADETGGKVRVRGRGSGYLEVDGEREAPVPLMVSVSNLQDAPTSFKRAVDMTVELLLMVTSQYKVYCRKEGRLPSPLFSFDEMCDEAREMLSCYVDVYPPLRRPGVSLDLAMNDLFYAELP